MKYFSMFSGIGGFELGIERANLCSWDGNSKATRPAPIIESLEKCKPSLGGLGDNAHSNNGQEAICIGYSEIDKYAIQIYKKHFGGKNYGDATEIDTGELPDFDLLVGGFPCQSFSIAGKRKGFDDTRGTLLFDIARILKDKRPRYFLLENVKGLLSHDKGKTFQTILEVLSDLGYFVEWQVLNSKNFGVPQNRERVFFVGRLGGSSERKVFPIRHYDRLPKTEDGTTERQTQATTVRPDIGTKADGTYIIHNVYGGFGESKNREFHDISPTIRTPKGGGHLPMVVNKTRIRRLTPVECERLQGFPDGWTEGLSDTQRYKCLGNAVTVNVIEAIIREMLK